MRFAPGASRTGVQNLAGTGLRIASSSEFKTAAAVPNDFDGADVQYFERFGIAIIRRDPERAGPMLRRAADQNVVTASRPERLYRALGAPGTRDHEPASPILGRHSIPGRDYLMGYRDGVTHVVHHLLDGRDAGISRASAQLEERVATWGLEATRTSLSTLTGAGIKVAVLDTGFDDTHPDFFGRRVTKKVFASNSLETDQIGHGTHCVGTACGPRNPASGPRYGIAYEAEIYAGKVLGDDGYGTDRSVIAGMDWALEQGCQIISMSLGAATNLGDQPVEDYEQIGHVCLDAGTLVIAASGNESARPGQIAPVGSPANASTIMAVAAVDLSMNVAPFSCGGMNPHQEVDIAAPGVDILSSLPGGRYARWQGTSMATPHVAGIAALLAQSDMKYRGWTLWARLQQLARPLALPARDVGKGLVMAPPN